MYLYKQVRNYTINSIVCAVLKNGKNEEQVQSFCCFLPDFQCLLIIIISTREVLLIL